MRVLLVEDDETDRNHISRLIREHQLDVACYENAVSALNYAKAVEPDIVITDLRLKLPGANGLHFAQQIRRLFPHCTLILVSRALTLNDAIQAIRIGVDDIIQKKDIQPETFMSQVWEDVMRSRARLAVKSEDRFQTGPLYIDTLSRTATWFDEPLRLTSTEFLILSHLAAQPDTVFTFNELHAVSMGDNVDLDPTHVRKLVQNHIVKMREKLEKGGLYNRNHIISVRGTGYKWSAEGESLINEDE